MLVAGVLFPRMHAAPRVSVDRAALFFPYLFCLPLFYLCLSCVPQRQGLIVAPKVG